GVQCVDSAMEDIFTLHVHILSLSDDLPALAKVINRHVYFPLKPPTGMSGRRYNPKNLPLRTHDDYLRDAVAVECVDRKSYKREVQARAAFKAEDWLNWVVLYSLPLLQGHLPK
ncbi:729_t:CDS:2, partial [Cetraspora pellucida]